MDCVDSYVLFLSVLLCCCHSSYLVAFAQDSSVTQWIQLNMCSEETRVTGSTAEPRGYAVFPLGKCILYKGGNYQLWNEIPYLQTSTEHAYTRGIYSDSVCSSSTAGGEQSLVIPISCEVVIIPGHLDPYPNILYSAQVLDAIPSIPKSGWTDLYFDEDDCGKLLGFTYMRLDTCQFDSNEYIIDYEKLDIPVCDFKLTGCDTLWHYNSADNTCVPTDIIRTPKMLPKRFGKCTFNVDNPFVFTVSNGMNVRTECEIPGVPDLVCFSGQETVHTESGEIKMLSNVQIGDKIQVANIVQGKRNSNSDDNSGMIQISYSNVIAIPHEKNHFKALFHEICTKSGHSFRVTADHVLPVYRPPLSSSIATSLFVDTLAQDVSLGSFLIVEEGILDEVTCNSIVTSYGLYSVVIEDLESYVVVSGIAASPFAVSHGALSWFYSFLHKSGFLRTKNYKDHWAYRAIENAASALYLSTSSRHWQ